MTDPAMLKRLSVFLLLLLAVCALMAQYNEKEILSQQAFQMLGQRQFSEAERLFNQIHERWPEDQNSILQLLNIYFQTSQLDKAETLLNSSRRILPANQAQEQEIQLLVLQGKPDQAWELGQSYIQRQNYSDNSYRLMASFFERRGFYDRIIRLYGEARSRKGNPDLFRLELANANLNNRQFGPALQEYLAFLEKNPANLYFVNNQCKAILLEDPAMISVIGEYAAKSRQDIISELYAGALAGLDKHAEALEIYKKLPRDKLLRFSGEQFNALNDEIALPAYEHLAATSTDPVERGDHLVRQAQILFRNGDYTRTKLILERVLADSLLLLPRNLQSKGVNLNARKLMAANSLALGKDIDGARHWYNEAKKFCYSRADSQDIDLSLARLDLIGQDYAAVAAALARVDDPGLFETRDYLRFSAELLSGNTDAADSLMNDYVISYPAGKYVNDAIYQMMFALGLEGSDRQDFFSAWRLMLLRDPAAVDTLQAIFTRSGDEELLTLAVEWAILLAEQDKARELLAHDWQDPVNAEYAALLRLTLTEAGVEEQRLARDFLKENPNSIFAPKFRQSLSRINNSRPEF